MKYRIKKGNPAKLIELNANEDAKVTSWVVRKDHEFGNCLIDPIVVKSMVEDAQKSLAGSLANQGYALFGGDSGGDRDARYVLAILYSQLEIIP